MHELSVPSSAPAAERPFIVSRRNDPESFPLPAEEVDKIPRRSRKSHREVYRNGGLNIYGPAAAGLHPADREEHFLFSVSMEYALEHLPEMCENFAFPSESRRIVPVSA